MNGDSITELLRKYGAGETETLIPQLVTAIEKRKKATLPTAAQFYTPEQVSEMELKTETGEPFALDEGWLLKITPARNGGEPAVSYISPEKWEFTGTEWISPEGQHFTQEELEAQLEAPEVPLEVEDVFGKVFGIEDAASVSLAAQQTLDWMSQSDENLTAFLNTIRGKGRSTETEELLTTLFPDITTEDIGAIFGEGPGVTEEAKAGLGAAWEKLTTGEFKWYEIKDTLMGTLGVAGAYLEKYAQRPWEATIMEVAGALLSASGQATEADIKFKQTIDDAFKKYGAGAFFSEEVATAWESMKESATPLQKKFLIGLEWANPIYIIPIGGTFGWAARFTSKIPVLGRTMKGVAAGVNAIEKGVTYPIAKPAELGLKGLARVGERLGEKLVNRLIGESEHLLLEIPASEQIIKGIVVDNWVKKTLQFAAKIPLVKGGIEKALGWRVLVSREGQLLTDVVGRGAVAYAEIQRMGINAARWKIAELYAIDANPVKLFGLNKVGFSETMLKKLLPTYAEQKSVAGTLEHIFTHPEMYSLTEKQLQYVTRVNEINTQVLNMLKKEGVPPEHLIEDWIHRIVTGREVAGEEVLVRGRPGMGGRGIGAKPAYEKPRAFKTMAEGLAEGFKYDPDITHSVGSYIEGAFNKIAATRFENYVAEFGRTATERLAERYPGLAERAALTQTELADAAKFSSVINRAIRGEAIPEQTIRAMERRFPELGAKFRSIVKGEPMKPIDEAAYLAEHGDKGLFDYPQPIKVRGIGKDDWAILTVPERVNLVKRLGLEGKVGSKSWGALTAEERALITTGEAIKPKIEGITGLEAKTKIEQIKLEAPQPLTAAGRRAELTALRKEINLLTEERKAPYWQARAEKAAKMEIVRQPGIGEGYIMQPFAGGRIYSEEFIDAFNRFFGHDKGLGVLRVTSDIAGILRITKAALDFSAMAIQGLPSFGLAHAYMLINPRIGFKLMGRWWQAFGTSVGAFFNPDIFWKYMAKSTSVGQRISFGGSSRAIDYFTALEARGGLGGFGAKALNKIPLNPFQRAEISFFSAGEIVRDEFWKILSPKALAAGKEFELARHLDLITGIFEARAAGVPLTIRQLESSFMWFAPNYTRACLTVLADIFRGGYTGGMARKALGGLIAAGAAYYTGVQFAISSLEGKSSEEAWQTVMEGFGVKEDPITHEVTWQPTGRFMTLKVGNYYFGVGGFWYGLVRLAGNINACINEVGDKEIIDLVRIIKNGEFNRRDNPFIYWWFSRASPLVGTGFELASGKDFLGYPIETPEQYAEYIITRFEPIWMEQGVNWLVPGLAREHEIPEDMARAAVPILEVFGLRTFPESQWVKFYDKADEYIQHIPEGELDPKQLEAWRAGKLGWAQLTDIQKANLLARYPELQELYAKAQADSAVRQSKEWEAYTGRIEEERGIYYDRIDELTRQLLRGEIDTREYREKGGEAGMNYGSILDAMQRDPTYAAIYEYFDKKEAEGDKYGFLDDLALAELQSTILYAEDLTLPNGDYDWDERDRRIDAFIDKWGQATYDRLQQYIQQQKGLKGLSEIWVRKSADTEKLGRTYWRLPYKPIIEMEEAEVPAQYYADWKAYQALKTDAEREAFITAHPDLAKDFRAEYRKDNPEADAMLALWGYGGKLQSMETYNLVEQWSRELGIPLESIGQGLPPRSLLDDYFGYADLTRQFSGNSAQAKLFRLEHPNFDAWGQENLGWKPISDTTAEKLRIAVDWQEKWSKLETEYRALPAAGYEQEWFLMAHQDFYQAAKTYFDWKDKDFSKVPTREVYALYQTWQNLPKGKARRDFEAQHPDLDMWLHITKGTKLESEK
jgi:hypothetical protein